MQKPAQHITAGLRLRFAIAPSAQLAVWSLRLLKAEAQASCPHCKFVNPRAVIRNGSFGEMCLKDRAAEAKPETTRSSPLEMEYKLKIIRSKRFIPSEPQDESLHVMQPVLVSWIHSPRCHPEGSFLAVILDRRHKDFAARSSPQIHLDAILCA